MSKINLNDVCWIDDYITRRFVAARAAELEEPMEMTPSRLSETTTYCQTNDNPYAEALMRKAGVLDKFQATEDLKERGHILSDAAKHFGILLF